MANTRRRLGYGLFHDPLLSGWLGRRHYIWAMAWVRSDGYLVTDDQQRIDIAQVHHWLSEESYWAAGGSKDLVSKSVPSSITLGCLGPVGVQVGVTRPVTDGSTFGSLTDVFVDDRYRGLGLGKSLVQPAVDHPEARTPNRILLCTDDAHGLYRSIGFVTLSNPERWLEWRPPSTPISQSPE